MTKPLSPLETGFGISHSSSSSSVIQLSEAMAENVDERDEWRRRSKNAVDAYS